ncbi:MAG: hypothetical protein IJS60_08950 [Abditibacteriota bacterium]|nr:hypothetical protein [Abditibacteriota bacterium]
MKYIMHLYLLLVVLLVGCQVMSGEYLISDFEDTDISAFSKCGHSEYLNDYTINVAQDTSYCLEAVMHKHAGWFGVHFPDLNKLPISNIQKFSFDVKEIANCPEINFEIFLKDGSRWGHVTPINKVWKHVELKPEIFFAVDNPNNLEYPDFTQIAACYISLRQAENWEGDKAGILLDNIKITCDFTEDYVGDEIVVNKVANLKGVRVVLVDTSVLPPFGQGENAISNIQKALKKAGANVVVCKDLSKFSYLNSVIVYESAVIKDGDFKYLKEALKKGNSLVWFGVDVPFTRLLKQDDKGEIIMEKENAPANKAANYLLTKGTFMPFDRNTNPSPFKLTEEGAKVFPDFPEEIPPVNSNYLTVDDSIWLNQQYPWVDYKPLITFDYIANNWVFLDRPFKGSVVSEFVHHAGDYAGSVMIFASMSTSGNSLINPNGGAYGYFVTSLVKEASKKVKIDKDIDKIPPASFQVTRQNFFHNDFKIMGGLNFDGCDMSDEDNIYAIKRMGYNCILIGIPWTNEKNREGYYIDFDKCDKWIKDAEKLKIGIIFDPYCFGWNRFGWSQTDNGKQAGRYLYNKTFKDLFALQMKGLCERYKDSPALLAVFATPDTDIFGFGYPDDSEVTKEAWAKYAKAHNLNTSLPQKPTEKGTFMLTPENEAWVDCWYENVDDFMTKACDTIREVIPDLPILLRGSYLDASQGFKFAEKYDNIGPYCECMETSVDVEAYFRGLSITYDTTIGGENGWPKERGVPLRMTMADVLLGGYKYYLYSFAAVPYAQPGVLEFDALSKVWGNVINADRIEGNTAMLISDSTIWTSPEGNFFHIEGRKSSGYIMERLGIGFGAVSAHFMDNIDKYKVIVDNGANDVLTKRSREKLVKWIENGGSLVCYPWTGRFDMSGINETLPGALGIKFEPGEYSVGKGKVIVLSEVGTDDKDYNMLKEALIKAGSEVTVSQDIPISSTAYKKGDNIYYVYFNKRKEVVSSFFSEERRPATEAALTETEVNIDLPEGKTKATELVTGKELKVVDGKTTLTIPPSWYALVKFE